MKQHEWRTRVFEFLYQIQVNSSPREEQLALALKLAAEDGWPEKARIAFDETVRGLWSQETVIDEAIAKHLRRWSFERLARVDRAILRLALYEILFKQEAFAPVVHEAVLLAKQFSTESSRRFINGLLAQFDPERHPQAQAEVIGFQSDSAASAPSGIDSPMESHP